VGLHPTLPDLIQGIRNRGLEQRHHPPMSTAWQPRWSTRYSGPRGICDGPAEHHVAAGLGESCNPAGACDRTARNAKTSTSCRSMA
jgi:hypothetical protein